MRGRAWVTGLGVLAAAATLAGCGTDDRPPERAAPAPAIPVRVVIARPEPVPLEAEAVGTVRARATTVIASTLSGYVAEVRVREGSRVGAGDLLVRLDDADVQAQRARAEAALEAARHAREEAAQSAADGRTQVETARSAVVEARAGLEAARRTVEEGEAAVTAAEAQADLARATRERYRQVFDDRALSVQEWEEVVARERTAQAELARVRARLESARSAHDQARSRAAQAVSAAAAAESRAQALAAHERAAAARIGEAEAEAARTRVLVGYTRISAPSAGLVVEKTVEPGDLAMPGRPLLRLDDPGGYRLEAELDASRAGALRPGDPALVWLGDTAAPVHGRVGEILPAADPATRTVTVRVDLPPVPGLRSGIYGKARFTVGRTERLRVPAAALAEQGSLTGVYVVDGDTARLRFVTVGERREDRVEVLSGLRAGERVVAGAAPGLRDGARVTAAD